MRLPFDVYQGEAFNPVEIKPEMIRDVFGYCRFICRLSLVLIG